MKILVTGFGPFPGSPYNPTEQIVKHIARLRRPALAAHEISTHVFPTSYPAVDRDLPTLLREHRPDALLMFGLAPRATTLRIEMLARNTLAAFPDASGASLNRRSIMVGGPRTAALPFPAQGLLSAARVARVPVALSRNAGRYLCNYLCWRAAEAAQKGSPRLAAFIHVPRVPRFARPKARVKCHAATLTDLTRAASAILVVLAASG
jgi:pyroglutamyl-peptidase